MLITCSINHKEYTEEVAPGEFLIDFLRKHGCYSVKRGCETSNCGLCSVLLNDKLVLSCSVLACSVDGKSIVTLEGLQKEAEEFGMLMANEGADQCGYCNPGFIMNVIAMKKELGKPTEEEAKAYLVGNLCRCTGYAGQMRAVMNYIGRDSDV